ncbi:MAG: hypothetical protein H6738_23060 [Alphaproteobacteria bacterium]|nr:hypothetical protein [Alphaproteobacteria bacterium]MCB9699684.1 hypothetical protein [Alphaproteobacteria bacterium]
MADPSDPIGAFAPSSLPPSGRISVREAAAFVLERLVRVSMGPITLLLGASLLGIRDRETLVAAAAFGTVMWLPTTALLFRLTFFPRPADPGMLDHTDRPVSVRDLRLLLRTHLVEHLLGTLPLMLLVAATHRLLDPRVAGLVALAGTTFVVWRILRVVLHVAIQDAELDAVVGQQRRAIARLGFLSPLPGFGDAGWMVLARARFRDGDPAGAVDALDHVRRSDWRIAGLRAQMGIAVLPLEELERTRDELAAGDPEQASIALVIDGMLKLRRGLPLEPRHVDHFTALPEGEPRRLGALLVAAHEAPTDPSGAAARLRSAGVDRARLEAMRGNWPEVAARIAPLLPEERPGRVR